MKVIALCLLVIMLCTCNHSTVSLCVCAECTLECVGAGQGGGQQEKGISHAT